MRGYNRSDLSQFGFEQVSQGVWLGDRSSFKTSDLQAWFPGFDARRDIADMDTASFLIGYEDLDLLDDSTSLDALIQRATPPAAQPVVSSAQAPISFDERIDRIRAQVDLEDVASIVTAFPEESFSNPFSGEIDPKTRQWYVDDFGIPRAGGEVARRHVEALASAAQQHLVSDVERYNDLRARGVAALSNYDIGVAYSGDALVALRQSLRTKEGHILFQRRRLAILGEVAEQLAPPAVEEQAEPQDSSQPDTVSEAPTSSGRKRAVKSAERQRARIEDAGEKIGGARKDFYAKALTRADLDGMNDREKLELVNRDNIWPRKTLEQFREEGVDCRVALFVNALRKDLPGKIANADHSDAYINFVTKLRDCATALRTREDLFGDHDSPFESALVEAGIIEITRTDRSTTRRVAEEYQGVVGGSDMRGWRFASSYLMDPSRAYRRAKALYDGQRFRIDDKWVSPSEMDSDELYAFIEQRQAKANDKRAKTLASREDEPNQYLSRPHLDHLQRMGLPDERGGRDIKPDDFLETFGFRGCEFGNWLPDIERQDVLNRAYDSLSTLARVLAVPKAFLSLGGTLALAFGSRGVGRALAHYEPARKVINLTRLKGAGSLSHEFFHAFDDYLGEHVREAVAKSTYRATLSDSYYASELFLTRERVRGSYRLNEVVQPGYVPADLRDRLQRLVSGVSALTIRRFTEDEAKSVATHSLEATRYQICNQITGLLGVMLPDQSYVARHSTAERMTEEVFQEVAEDRAPSLRPGERHPLVERLSNMRPQTPLKRTEANAYVATLHRLADAIHGLPQIYRLANDRDALLQSEHMNRLVNTKYFKDAAKFDDKKPKPYWSSVRELAARAFEAYVQDQCAERGWRDDYLVHGTEESRFELSANSPYPVGPDRERLRVAFDDLMDFARDELGADVSRDEAETAPRPKAA
ncbi:LPD1 domain-containing protein [Paraburkholderia hospita]|uniref:LPD1 domain-containing protein n=1 Tax=Paraburkholderia hospita TaxID=169430 RepID=UPI00115F7904|nr:LPD1 domain-containing protein [Paraburkholderia hospita]